MYVSFPYSHVTGEDHATVGESDLFRLAQLGSRGFRLTPRFGLTSELLDIYQVILGFGLDEGPLGTLSPLLGGGGSC